jgi:hypothetical protein
MNGERVATGACRVAQRRSSRTSPPGWNRPSSAPCRYRSQFRRHGGAAAVTGRPPEEAWRTLDNRPAEPRFTLALASANATTPALPVDLRLGIEHILQGPDHLLFMLGPEIVHSWRGESSLTIRFPLLVAILFSLLHGAGLAGGLQQLGLPKAETLQALALFNLGVEIGKLAFIALVLLVVALWGRRRLPTPL